MHNAVALVLRISASTDISLSLRYPVVEAMRLGGLS